MTRDTSTTFLSRIMTVLNSVEWMFRFSSINAIGPYAPIASTPTRRTSKKLHRAQARGENVEIQKQLPLVRLLRVHSHYVEYQ